MQKSYALERTPILWQGERFHVYGNLLKKFLPFGVVLDTKWASLFLETKAKSDKALQRILMQKRVHYFSPKEQRETLTTVRGDRLYQIGLNKEGAPTALKAGVYIFIFKDGKLHVTPKTHTAMGQIQHSSFLSGDPVEAAGVLMIRGKGRVVGITNKSGHYKPGAKHTHAILQHLQRNLSQPAFSRVRVTTQPRFANWNLVRAFFFLRFPLYLFFRRAPKQLSLMH
jgi:hypothetical protein